MPTTYRLTTDTVAQRVGRSFGSSVLAMVTASGLHEMSQHREPLVPIYVALAVSAGETRAVLENLRAGRPARLHNTCNLDHTSKGERVELKRSVEYRFFVQETEAGAVITAHAPDLFDYEYPLLDDDIRAVVMPSLDDVHEIADERKVEVMAAIAHVKQVRKFTADDEMVGLAMLVCRYLAQRCDLPIPHDPSFAAQFFLAALDGDHPILAKPISLTKSSWEAEDCSRVRESALSRIGFRAHVDHRARIMQGVAVMASAARLEALLAEQTHVYESTRLRAKAARPVIRHVAPPGAVHLFDL